MKHLFSLLATSIFLFFAFGSDETSKNEAPKSESNVSTQEKESKKETPCIGSENCITFIRNNFRNTGKQILGEQYLGQGQFGISFLDINRGQAFNANVTTDCNCELINVHISIMR